MPSLEDLKWELELTRRKFRAKIREILRQAYADGDTLSTAIGDISFDEAYKGWSEELIKRLKEEK